MRRLSVRDFYWLTVVLALAIGWWLEHRQFVQFIESTKAWLDKPPAIVRHAASTEPSISD